jgi:hypothetical protein
VSLVSRLPVPLVLRGDPAFDRLSELSRTLMNGRTAAEETDAYAELQALAARLYGLSHQDFTHVLQTFPLVPAETKSRALARFNGCH